MKKSTPRLVKIRDEGQRAGVVLVHGFGGRADETWGDLPAILRSADALREWDIVSLGYSSNLVASILGFWKRPFWKRQPPLQSLADGLVTRFSSVEPLISFEAVVLLAHSMGGLVVQRALIDSASLRQRTRKVLLFGTPSGGLELARLGRRLDGQVKGMAAGGQFIGKLRTEWEDLRPLEFDFVAVKGAQDFFVPPESSQGPFPELRGLEFPQGERATVAGDHVTMVKPLNVEDETPQLVISRVRGDAAPEGIWSSAWVARGEVEARQTVELYGKHPDELDKQARVSLALAHDSLGERDKALEVLRLVREDDADGLGTLGGRYKRAWQETRRQSDAEKAIESYERGLQTALEKEQPHYAYYNGINIAYMKLAAEDDLEAARDLARKVQGWLAESTRPDAPWKDATKGEASAYLGDFDRALDCYRSALGSHPRPPAWAIASMYRQARSVADYLQEAWFGQEIEKLFRG